MFRSANTDSADVNEILFGYYMTNLTWNKNFVDAAKAQKQLELKKRR